MKNEGCCCLKPITYDGKQIYKIANMCNNKIFSSEKIKHYTKVSINTYI